MIANGCVGEGGGALPLEGGRAFLGQREDVRRAAEAVAAGAVVGYGFGNFYALTARPDEQTVRRVNLLKGRPAGQTGSVTTTPARIPLIFDWARLPLGVGHREVTALIDALYTLGPFGFRGPAAELVPGHLSCGGTVQVIAPGYSCPSNEFLAQSLARVSGELLLVTSANRSRHHTGAAEEPAHWQAATLRAEFGPEELGELLEHPDEEAARRNYPLHDPMSTTVLAFDRVEGLDAAGRPCLVVERHGSFELERVRRVADRWGFGLTLGREAGVRLTQR
ncbi:hypothetical protein CFP65_0137 [Kitasatospora sp. MMS16-BH015]|uniref:hypothetical protein n=1 Tax=Kitasatospora sp. MMS16-BH015 TaxID=2018025 RepID=UPI000CA2FFAC|nr:hypothetical protein [Kitasatospora sp. MMS16-BH015]AUG75121.1 hypothetical protein CFP65_0137 [Kitasatospora sp. MMS16-BH015]